MLNKTGILFFLLLTLDAINVAWMAVLLKNTLDTALSGNLNALIRVAVLAAAFLAEYSFVSLAARTLKVYYISDIMYHIKKDLVESLLKKSVKVFSGKNSAEYISLFNNDLKMLEENYISAVILIYRSTVILMASLVIMISIQPLVSFAAILLSFLPVLIPKIYGPQLSKRTENYTKDLKKYSRFIDDILRGFFVIKNLSLEDYMNEKHQVKNSHVEAMRQNLGRKKACADVITNLVAVGMQFGVFIISGFFVILGRITAGDVLAITQLMNKVVNPVFDIIDSLNNIKSVKKIENEILLIIKETKPVYPQEEILSLNEITLNDVSFSYGNRENALSHISLTLEKGKKYAIVGETGSGKSTLLKLIQGYFDNFSGQIFYNGKDIRNMGQDRCFQLFCAINQEVFLFEGTIRENILFHENPKESFLQYVLNAVTLNETLEKNGIDLSYELSNNGENLSGGEREKIALARILAKNRDWLLLDEATASMDNETLLQIEKLLINLKDVTCISITHRYQRDILKNYDQIIVLKRGRIAEIGHYEELINKNGVFRSLYQGKK